MYVSQIFNYLRAVLALPCAWLIDRLGLRRAVYLALVFALTRNVARMLLFSAPPELSAVAAAAPATDWHRELRPFYWSVCMFCENVVLLIYYSLPLKLSESWFPEHERSMAFTAMLALPGVGGAISSYVLPRIVENKQSLHWLAGWNLFASLIMVVITLITVTRSRPRQAPSLRSSAAERALLQQTIGLSRLSQIGVNIKNLMTNFHLLLHILTLTTFEAMSGAINGLVEDVLASSDLSEKFAGNFLALNGIYGIFVLLLSSYCLDRKSRIIANNQRTTLSSKQRTWLMKSFVFLTYLSFMLYVCSLSFEKFWAKYQWILVVGSSLLYGSIHSWTVPFFNDLVADLILASPVSQATVSAASGAIYVLLGNPYQMMFIYLRKTSGSPSASFDSRPRPSKADYSRSMLFAGLIVTSMTFVHVTCFRAPASSDDGDHNNSNNQTTTSGDANAKRRCCCCCCGGNRKIRLDQS